MTEAGEDGTCTLPVFVRERVVRGFGRGSKSLGVPTANLPTDSLEQVLKTIPPGVYYGFAAVGKDPTVYKVAASVGWNPHFNDVKKKTMEVHIIHNFEKDFYGEELRVAILGYIRAESAFSSLEQLIQTIKNDIAFAIKKLDESECAAVKEDKFFRTFD